MCTVRFNPRQTTWQLCKMSKSKSILSFPPLSVIVPECARFLSMTAAGHVTGGGLWLAELEPPARGVLVVGQAVALLLPANTSWRDFLLDGVGWVFWQSIFGNSDWMALCEMFITVECLSIILQFGGFMTALDGGLEKVCFLDEM
jgi:hypothetical protein